MKGLLVAFGLIACAAALPTQDYLVEIAPNGEKICRENCGRRFNWECPRIPCPRTLPQLAEDCAMPSCLTNDAWWLLWPHPENEFQFLQCRGMGIGDPIERDCPCGTFFDYKEQRCVHAHEYSPLCPKLPATPRPIDCPAPDDDCNACDDGSSSSQAPGTSPAPTTAQQPGGGCPCVCVPCVAWPCSPCPTNCCRAFGYEEVAEEH